MKKPEKKIINNRFGDDIKNVCADKDYNQAYEVWVKYWKDRAKAIHKRIGG